MLNHRSLALVTFAIISKAQELNFEAAKAAGGDVAIETTELARGRCTARCAARTRASTLDDDVVVGAWLRQVLLRSSSGLAFS